MEKEKGLDKPSKLRECWVGEKEMMRAPELKGKTFGKWRVIRRGPNNSQNDARWWCRCECGNKRLVHSKSLVNGGSSQCMRCRNFGYIKMEIIGAKFGFLTVEKFAKISRGNAFFKVKCDCGNRKTVEGVALKRGNIKSCGCLCREMARKPHSSMHNFRVAIGLTSKNFSNLEERLPIWLKAKEEEKQLRDQLKTLLRS
jgi:hypothetical protein